MDDDMCNEKDLVHTIEQILPFVVDNDAHGRMYADFRDLIETSDWLVAELKKNGEKTLGVDDIEDFLINLDVNYIQHMMFHLKSLSKDVQNTLQSISKLG